MSHATTTAAPAGPSVRPPALNAPSPFLALFATGDHRHTIAPRLLAGLPLLAIGLMHVTGSAPLSPILRGTPLPLPELTAVLAPIVQVVAGLLIIAGAATRAGAILAIGAMLGAIAAHITFAPYPATEAYAAFDWPDEPPILLPIAVIVAAAYLLVRGAGRFSVDIGIGQGTGRGTGTNDAATGTGRA